MKLLPVFLVLLFGITIASAQTVPIPQVYQPLIPATATPGSQGFTLTVNGTGFATGAKLFWNGSPRATSFVSSTQLTATIPAADVANAGTATVTVANQTRRPRKVSNGIFFSVRNSAGVTLTPGAQLGLAFVGAVVGDFNNDGNPDVATVQALTFEVDVYLSNGDGTFQPPIANVGSTTYYESLVPGDFNGDGNLDLAIITTGMEGEGVVLFGTGDGHLTASSQLGYIGGPMIVADFNGDGVLDLFTFNFGVDTLYLGKGNGNFKLRSILPFGTFATGDFNHDGKLDLVDADSKAANDGVIVLLANANGGFNPPMKFATSLPGGAVALADLNGDGNLDIVTSGLCVLLGDGAGTFKQAQCVGSGFAQTVPSIYLADFNGDGILDAVSYDTSARNIMVYAGNGDGTFQNPMLFPTGVPIGVLSGVADFNNDGLLDLLMQVDAVTPVIEPFFQTGQ